MDRCYGVSYFFSKTPSVTQVSDTGIIEYNPMLIYCEQCYEGNVENEKIIQCKKHFSISYAQMIDKCPTEYQKNKIYVEMRKRSREAQERIISEYICMIIIQELREHPGDDLTFIINDEFQSEKIIGRLGYLRLPLNRTHIMFVSRDIASFMTNHIERYAIPPQNDLKLLLSNKYRGRIVGAYPDESIQSMLRTYFCSFEQEGLYPLRVNVFSQALSKNELNLERVRLEKIFMSSYCELYTVIGGTGSELTRLPQNLIKCEDYIKNEKKNRK